MRSSWHPTWMLCLESRWLSDCGSHNKLPFLSVALMNMCFIFYCSQKPRAIECEPYRMPRLSFFRAPCVYMNPRTKYLKLSEAMKFLLGDDPKAVPLPASDMKRWIYSHQSQKKIHFLLKLGMILGSGWSGALMCQCCSEFSLLTNCNSFINHC